MGYAACHRGRGELSSARQRAAAFLDNLPFWVEHESGGRQNWITEWTNIGEDQCLAGDLYLEKGFSDKATEAWLCALTAFEIARRLADDHTPRCGDVSAKIEATIQKFELCLAPKVKRITVRGCDYAELPAYYLPADSPARPAPAVICISTEGDSGAALLGRLLPVVTCQGMSVLVVSHVDISNLALNSQTFLSCCFDYLSRQPEVDGHRIGVYGEGISAVLATDFAMSDGRLAAAVCDGGLWNSVRSVASIGWMTRGQAVVDDCVVAARRLQSLRRINCPILIVAGGRGSASVSEAIKLQADCWAAGVDLDLAMPRMIRSSEPQVENFVSSDDSVVGWLMHKLASRSTPSWGQEADPCRYGLQSIC